MNTANITGSKMNSSNVASFLRLCVPQDANCDRMSVSSLTSAEAECSSLLDSDSCFDPDGFTSPQHGSVSRARRSPVGGYPANLGSPSTPNRVFRHNSFSGSLHVLLMLIIVLQNISVNISLKRK